MDEEAARHSLAALSPNLDEALPEIDLYERYYAGKHNLRFATRKFREAFGGLFREFSDNWCEVVVDACVERLEVQGFRFASAAAQSDSDAENAETIADPRAGDMEAWDIWQANGLDCTAEIAHTQAFVAGRCYIIVGPQPDGSTDTPLITVEHPSQVIVEVDPANRRHRTAGLKRWWDKSTGLMMATVYGPNDIWKFQSAKAYEKPTEAKDIKWVPRGEAGGWVRNTTGIVPVVPLVNKESLLGAGDSELSQVVPMQDLLNKYVTDMTVASEFQAYKQRVLMGVEVPRYPDDHPDESLAGQPLPNQELVAAASRLWMFEDKDVKIQELQGGDLKAYVDAITLVRNHIAARTRTPPHYLLGEIVNASGDALKAAEAGLVSKVRRRMRFFGESWEEVMRLAFLLKGDDVRGNDHNAETIWRNPETVTEAQLMDALGKLAVLGVPREVLWERAGFSPTEIARMKQMQAASPVPEPDDVTAGPGAAALVRAGASEGL